ncbi:MAG TPA: UbiX family flavin prenyltransferase [Anaerolineae bacterium]
MRIVVGISGSTGAIYGIRLLQVLHQHPDIETHLVMSDPARKTIALETEYTAAQVEELATHVHPIDDIAASIASGSFKTAGMAVVPCSMKTLSAIANSYNDNLLVRAADVTLKERRRLVLVARETPLHLGHLRSMLEVTEMGAILAPPMPAFYNKPRSIDDIVNQTVGRVLDLLGVEHADLFKRWTGLPPESAAQDAAGEPSSPLIPLAFPQSVRG